MKMRMKNSCVLNFFMICVILAPSFQQKLVENCGIKLDDITKTISSSDTKSNFAPWVVSIGFGEEIMDEYEPLCTGTIIKGWTSKRPFFYFLCYFLESVVLTAAHCITDRRYVRIVVNTFVYVLKNTD